MQLKALAGLMSRFGGLSSQQLQEPLPMVTAAFVGIQIRSVAGRRIDMQDHAVQEGLQTVMQHALHQIQVHS